MEDDASSGRALTHRSLAVERDGATVKLIFTCEAIYESMQFYDEICRAIHVGHLTLDVEVDHL
jgi:hypothetical protein